MTPTDGERLVAGLVLDPGTRQRCSPRYDEMLLVAAFNTESLVTIVYRGLKRGRLRVLQLSRHEDRWSIASENSVPIVTSERPAPARLEYPDREFHFVPGSGVAPAWVEVERPERAEGC